MCGLARPGNFERHPGALPNIPLAGSASPHAPSRTSSAAESSAALAHRLSFLCVTTTVLLRPGALMFRQTSRARPPRVRTLTTTTVLWTRARRRS